MYINAIIKFNNSSFNINERITGAHNSNDETGDPEDHALFPAEFVVQRR